MPKTVVLSVGGSLINPGKIQTNFLKRLKKYLLSSPNKFILVCGGGAPARRYAKAGKAFGLSTKKTDKIGIAATLLNAELVRHVFGAPPVKREPNKTKFTKFLVAGGWKTGASSDYDTVLWAKKNSSNLVINLTNIDHIYTKDPKKSGAKPLKKISWKEYRKIIGDKWDTGIHVPFDPIASKFAQKNKMTVACINGKKLSNLDKYMKGKKFTGTVIG